METNEVAEAWRRFADVLASRDDQYEAIRRANMNWQQPTMAEILAQQVSPEMIARQTGQQFNIANAPWTNEYQAIAYANQQHVPELGQAQVQAVAIPVDPPADSLKRKLAWAVIGIIAIVALLLMAP